MADHVGYGLHREQCRKRWSMAANVELQSRRKGDWTDDEVGYAVCFVFSNFMSFVVASFENTSGQS